MERDTEIRDGSMLQRSGVRVNSGKSTPISERGLNKGHIVQLGLSDRCKNNFSFGEYR